MITPYLYDGRIFLLFQRICKQYEQCDNPTLECTRLKFDQDDSKQWPEQILQFNTRKYFEFDSNHRLILGQWSQRRLLEDNSWNRQPRSRVSTPWLTRSINIWFISCRRLWRHGLFQCAYLDVETDVVSRHGFLQSFVVHFNRLDLSGQSRRCKDDQHSWNRIVSISVVFRNQSDGKPDDHLVWGLRFRLVLLVQFRCLRFCRHLVMEDARVSQWDETVAKWHPMPIDNHLNILFANTMFVF